jgi:monoamine oxidase
MEGSMDAATDKKWGQSFATLLLRAIPLADTLEEAIEAVDAAMAMTGGAAFGMVGDEWHGPEAPGPGWVQVGQGERGGLIWKHQGEEGKAATPEAAQDDVVRNYLNKMAQETGLTREQIVASLNRVAAPQPAKPRAPKQPSLAESPAVKEATEALTAFTNSQIDKKSSPDQLPMQVLSVLNRLSPPEVSHIAKSYRISAAVMKEWKKPEDAAQGISQAILGEIRRSLESINVSLNWQLDAAFSFDIFNRRAQSVLNKAVAGMKELSASARRELKAAISLDDTSAMGQAIIQFVQRYRMQLGELLGATNLSALLAGAREVADKMPPVPLPGIGKPPPPSLPPDAAAGLLSRLEAMPERERAETVYQLPPEQQEWVNRALVIGTGPPMPPFTPSPPPSESPGAIHFPTIEEAVKDLSERNVVSRADYERLDAAARQKAFTVAGVESQETLTKIRDALAETVAEGADVEAFRQKVLERVEPDTFLSPAHLDVVARANIQAGFSDGQMAVLNMPFVRSGFPYASVHSIADDRRRHEHGEVEKIGIQGTNIFRVDDPVFETFRGPWDFSCRCGWTPMSVKFAAEKGIEEAARWLESGIEPSPPAFVPFPSFRPPPEFQRALAGAPLSIRLSMQPMDLGPPQREAAAFAIDSLMEPEFAFGTEPPGPGWEYAGQMKWVRRTISPKPLAPQEGSPRIAVIGGGPGGLFTAYILNQKLPAAAVTIFEASGRLGGKIDTAHFSDGTPYEAGVAELYEYLGPKPDPLRQLIEDDLGLPTVNMQGGAVHVRGKLVRDMEEVHKQFGYATRKRIEAFHKKVAVLMPLDKYAQRWQPDNEHPWAGKTFAECVREELTDDADARAYIETAIHSDLATEPWTCNGLNGIKNALMDHEEYMQLYHVVGGVFRVPETLSQKIRADVRLEARVKAVDKKGDSYTVQLQDGTTEGFDAVVLCLPNHWLNQLEWPDGLLKDAIQRMLAHYDLPAHYLRVSFAFRSRWWDRLEIPGDFWMMDAFHGCCVYDESRRWKATGSHVLSFLIAGQDALNMVSANQSDAEVARCVMAALPEDWRTEAQDNFIESRVERYIGAINAQPGSWPAEELIGEHEPEPLQHPGLFIVGDFLFDSTLNAALISAGTAIDLLLKHFGKRASKGTPAVEQAKPKDGVL